MPTENFWPPNEEEWPKLLEELPAAGRNVARTLVAKAVREHADNAEHDRAQRDMREKVAEVSGRNVAEMTRSLDQFARHEFKAARDHLKAFAQNFSAELKITFYLPRSRRKRLLMRLMLAWLAGGGAFAVSTGPLARFLSALMDRVPNEKSLTERGAKEALGHFARLVVRRAVLRPQVGLAINERKVLTIGPTGKPKP
jgi:hypothetical protein